MKTMENRRLDVNRFFNATDPSYQSAVPQFYFAGVSLSHFAAVILFVLGIQVFCGATICESSGNRRIVGFDKNLIVFFH